MPELVYSREAVKTLPRFHRADWIIYVEGQDDVVFWELACRLSGVGSFVLKEVGGDGGLLPYEQMLDDPEVPIMVARDRDYRDLCGEWDRDRRVVCTYGYAIENTLCDPGLVARVIEILARRPTVDPGEVAAWLEAFMDGADEALAVDIANSCIDGGVEVLGKNCKKFLRKTKRPSLNKNHLRSAVARSRGVSKAREGEIRQRLEDDERNPYMIVRGHFLMSAVRKYVEVEVSRIRRKTVRVPREHLFAQLVAMLEARWTTDRPDLAWIREQLEGARAAA